MQAVAITGAGIVSPIGTGYEAFGAAACAGMVGIGPAPYRDVPGAEHAWGGVVTDFDPLDWMDARVAEGSARFTHFALAAAAQAVEMAGIELDPDRTGCVHGTSMAGVDVLATSQHGLSTVGPEGVSRKLNIQAWPNMAGGQIALRWGLHGPLLTVSTACASSLDAIGLAAQKIGAGDADVMLAGGSDSAMCEVTFFSQMRYGMHRPIADPRRASLPFDVARSGIVEGEGSGMLLLERAEHALARGATILGWVRGYGTVSDAFHPSSPEPEGVYEERAVRLALADAALATDDIDAVYAHGTATPVGDAAEIKVLNRLFGERVEPIPVTSLKGHVGHSGGAANVTALIAGLYGMARGVVPPTAGTTELDPEIRFRVPIGTEPLPHPVRAFLVNGFGFGGQDSSMVIGAAAG
ncbi:MAG: beta-ketoacyl-[acyl-carrier-protein] synthase family protein [Acidimicrobiia bacterium]|nr:beta-ketoacyl-[acyl-carrier-protein] synthase family protein [Acidimicrobiia bacterium]